MQRNLVTNSTGDFYDSKVHSKCQNKKYLSVTLVLKQNTVVNKLLF